MLNSNSGKSWGASLGCALLLTVTTSLSPSHAAAQQPAAPDTTCLALSDSSAALPDSAAVKSRFKACAQRADSTRRADAVQSATAAARPTYDVFFSLPEAGDEQRLDDGSGQQLGPVAFIFPSPFANGFTRRSQIAVHPAPGLLVAVVVVRGNPGDPVPQTYANLQLQTGVNCIWLFAPGPNPGNTYQVFVTSTPSGSPCNRSNPRGPLFVDERHIGGFAHADYPPSPRFDEIPPNQPVLGFKCLNAWCEAGPSAFTQHPPPASVSGKEGKIKGWFDEQYLAERVGGVWTKRMRAAVFPVPNLDRLDRSDFAVYRRVAWLYIFDPIPAGSKYASWGMGVGANHKNKVELKFDAASSKWSVRITPQGGTPITWTEVEEMPHLDVPIPGTVRFRFTVEDDGIWVPCGQSCCRAKGT